jgi:hypothetical protein
MLWCRSSTSTLHEPAPAVVTFGTLVAKELRRLYTVRNILHHLDSMGPWVMQQLEQSMPVRRAWAVCLDVVKPALLERTGYSLTGPECQVLGDLLQIWVGRVANGDLLLHNFCLGARQNNVTLRAGLKAKLAETATKKAARSVERKAEKELLLRAPMMLPELLAMEPTALAAKMLPFACENGEVQRFNLKPFVPATNIMLLLRNVFKVQGCSGMNRAALVETLCKEVQRVVNVAEEAGGGGQAGGAQASAAAT